MRIEILARTLRPIVPVVFIYCSCLSPVHGQASRPPFKSSAEPGQVDVSAGIKVYPATGKKTPLHQAPARRVGPHEKLPAFRHPRPARIWTSADGKQAVKANLLQVCDHDRTIVFRIDGELKTAEWAIFSKSDQEYILQIANRIRALLETRDTKVAPVSR